MRRVWRWVLKPAFIIGAIIAGLLAALRRPRSDTAAIAAAQEEAKKAKLEAVDAKVQQEEAKIYEEAQKEEERINAMGDDALLADALDTVANEERSRLR